MKPEEQAQLIRMKITAAAKQHAMDWGTGIVSREQREHSFRIGDAHGYQRAIDELRGQTDFSTTEERAYEKSASLLEEKQKQLLNSLGALL